MRHRPAVTLIEVLVAIFIMAVGMLALLVLFPLGALNMAQAIKDDRCAQAAAQAQAIANARGLRTDSQVWTNNPTDTAEFLNTGYPVYIDPLGRVVMSWTAHVGGNTGTSPRIPRRSASFLPVSNAALARQYCTLLDDLTFSPENGVPVKPDGVNLSREGRYTWAYMVRPLLGSPSPTSEMRSVADLDVVVYSGRNLEVQGGETPYTASVVSANSISLTYGGPGQKPNLRRGSWILDASPSTAAEINVFGKVHSFFYRVVSVEDTAPNTVQLELQTPLIAATPQTAPTISKVVVMDNVAEVFSKRTGWLP
jgi:hypothetical protein